MILKFIIFNFLYFIGMQPKIISSIAIVTKEVSEFQNSNFGFTLHAVADGLHCYGQRQVTRNPRHNMKDEVATIHPVKSSCTTSHHHKHKTDHRQTIFAQQTSFMLKRGLYILESQSLYAPCEKRSLYLLDTRQSLTQISCSIPKQRTVYNRVSQHRKLNTMPHAQTHVQEEARLKSPKAE